MRMLSTLFESVVIRFFYMEHDFLAVSVLCEQSAVTQVWHLLDVPEIPVWQVLKYMLNMIF